MKRKIALLALLFFYFTFPLLAQSFAKHFSQSALSGLFHYFENPLSATASDLYKENAKAKIQSIATWSFSAMIYGLDFTFVPNSLLYQVERDFTLTLRGKIDETRVVLEESKWDEELVDSSQMPIEYLATYYSHPHEIARRNFWNQSRFHNCVGINSIEFIQEADPFKAIEAAIQNGLIELFSKKLINKPRMICGKVILAQTPRFYVRANRLYAHITFLVEEQTVNSYLIP